MDNPQQSSPVELDELDLLLVRELQVDARRSNLDLAERLGTSATTVKRRIQKLTDGKIIRLFTLTEPKALGFHTQALVGINAVHGKVHALAGFLASHRSIRVIDLTAGRYDMLVSTLHENPSELLKFLDEDLGMAPGVVSAETMLVVKVPKTSLRHSLEGSAKSEDVKFRPLEEVELLLIEELERNPRETNIGLSRKLGMGRISVGRKLQALRADNIISVSCMAKASALGYHVGTAILIKASNGSINAVADALAADARTHHVVILAGQFDLCAWIMFRDSREMASYIRNDIQGIPGIIHHETMFEVGLAKMSLSFLT